ncbi:MAG: hypothetical protein M1603_01645 [Candidatus Marsarchaeota archaeon]|jgi:hypothetical protein|nr:hypothetical protein [Candidatus Marsarchaeota archaeon]
MTEENIGITEPDVDSFQISATLKGSFEAISTRLTSLQVFYISVMQNSLVLFRIESRDIQKRPFLFFIITMSQSGVSVQYSIPKDTSSKMRKLYVLRNLISILSLITDQYEVNQTELFQYLDSAIDDVINSLSQNYSALFNNYEALLTEHRELRRLNIELTNSNKNLTASAAQLKSDNDDMKRRLDALESYSDESLMALIEDWIESHESTIDVNEFSKNYKVVPPRVEQILNKMVSLGYIEVKG